MRQIVIGRRHNEIRHLLIPNNTREAGEGRYVNEILSNIITIYAEYRGQCIRQIEWPRTTMAMNIALRR